MKLLFGDTFSHDVVDEHTDSIIFKKPIAVAEIRIVRPNVQPYSSLPFEGNTIPNSFDLEVFLKNPSLDNFERLTNEPFHYKENFVDRIVTDDKEWITDQIVVRGKYQCLSLCIFGEMSHFVAQPPTPPPIRPEINSEAPRNTHIKNNLVTQEAQNPNSEHQQILVEELQYIDGLLTDFDPLKFIFKAKSQDDTEALSKSESKPFIDLFASAKKEKSKTPILQKMIKLTNKEISFEFQNQELSIQKSIGEDLSLWVLECLAQDIAQIRFGLQLCSNFFPRHSNFFSCIWE